MRGVYGRCDLYTYITENTVNVKFVTHLISTIAKKIFSKRHNLTNNAYAPSEVVLEVVSRALEWLASIQREK